MVPTATFKVLAIARKGNSIPALCHMALHLISVEWSAFLPGSAERAAIARSWNERQTRQKYATILFYARSGKRLCTRFRKRSLKRFCKHFCKRLAKRLKCSSIGSRNKRLAKCSFNYTFSFSQFPRLIFIRMCIFR